MKRKLHILLILIPVLLLSCTGNRIREISILETTDIHGMILPYDYILKKDARNSLASVSGYISNEAGGRDKLVLLDNGDNLQGQPSVYYYNFTDTASPHLLSQVFNYMGYDAVTVGNHDLEAGHDVYDRIRKEYNFPLLAANAVSTETGNPYFDPYTVIEKNGVRIAVLGMVTSSVPEWIPEVLYKGIRFTDMEESARKWMPAIAAEKPDIVVGLFHSGWDRANSGENGSASENEANRVAFNVPGFDIIFTGHDHTPANEKIVNSQGDTVLILNAGSHAQMIARADIKINTGKSKGSGIVSISGTLIRTSDYDPDKMLTERFAAQHNTVRSYVDKIIGESLVTVTSRDSYFGPSDFTGIIHSLQMEITGAPVSFAAPLSFDVEIPKGILTVGDMFKLYRYENMLYTMRLTGKEIKDYLEYSYSGWIRTMNGPDDNLMNFRTGEDGKPELSNGKARLRIPPYNFDSASGLKYSVDVRKPAGSRVIIVSMSDGTKFDPSSYYNVAINSYRGSGGGGHLTEGAGIPGEELSSRIISSTEKDLRFYMIDLLEKKKSLPREFQADWKFIPAEYITRARGKDYKLMFN